MMLEDILSSQDCALCQICCKFEEDELIDAPTFTRGEMENANRIYRASFVQRGNIYQVKLVPWKNKYICPFLTDKGCILGNGRPFDCKSWPFYLMRRNNQYVLTLTSDCPIVWKKYLGKEEFHIDDNLLDACKYIIQNYPEMITEYNRNMRVVYIF